MIPGRQATGRAGEDLAARTLQRAGYRIIQRNYRCPGGEIDIVAEDAGELVFVEVRTRRTGGLVSPEESVNRQKQQRIVRAAEHYLTAVDGHERPWRVDVVAIEVDGAGRVCRTAHLRSVVG
jgi:putative endonuclease